MRIPHTLTNLIFFSNPMCKKWLLVVLLCNLLVRREFGFIFLTPLSAGTCLGPSSSAGSGQGSASCRGRVPRNGNHPGWARCLCCSNSGKVMNLPGSKSSVGITWDSAWKGLSPVPGTSKHPTNAIYHRQPRYWCYDYHLHFSDVGWAALTWLPGYPRLSVFTPLCNLLSRSVGWA